MKRMRKIPCITSSDQYYEFFMSIYIVNRLRNEFEIHQSLNCLVVTLVLVNLGVALIRVLSSRIEQATSQGTSS